MKRLGAGLLLFLFLLLPSCGRDKATASQGPSTAITQEQALDLAKEKFGESDEETGFTYSWQFESMIRIEGVEYYDFRLSWLVENEEGTLSHISYLTNVIVSVDGGVIKEYTDNNQDG